MPNDMEGLAATLAAESSFINRIAANQRHDQSRRERIAAQLAELAGKLEFVPGDRVGVFVHADQPEMGFLWRGKVEGFSFRSMPFPYYCVREDGTGQRKWFAGANLAIETPDPFPGERVHPVGAEVVDVETDIAGKVSGIRYDETEGEWKHEFDSGNGIFWHEYSRLEVAA